MGLSQGAAVALGFAHAFPQRVERLVLVSPAGLGRRIGLGYLLAYLAVNLHPTPRVHRWLQGYVVADRHRYDEDLARYQLAVQAQPGGSRPCWSGRGRVVARFVPEVLAEIRNPTLILWGDRDRVLRAGRDAGAAPIPESRSLVVPGAGHALLFDQPERFMGLVRGFLHEDPPQLP